MKHPQPLHTQRYYHFWDDARTPLQNSTLTHIWCVLIQVLINAEGSKYLYSNLIGIPISISCTCCKWYVFPNSTFCHFHFNRTLFELSLCIVSEMSKMSFHNALCIVSEMSFREAQTLLAFHYPIIIPNFTTLNGLTLESFQFKPRWAKHVWYFSTLPYN